jgi:hypothetical protein
MTTTLTLNASAITRRLHSNGLAYVHSHTLRPGVVRVWLIEDDTTVDAAKRTARAVLMQAGYEVASAYGYENALLVTLPEPTEPEEDSAEHEWAIVDQLAEDGLDDGPAVEADVPPTDEERVTVRIRARELRPGDLVVDSLGARQYAAFDVQQAGSWAPHVKVWTAIRDQEEGLPPTLVMRAERELLVLRPVSAEGRELLAALDRTSTPTEPRTRQEWEQRVGMPWAEYERAMTCGE